MSDAYAINMAKTQFRDAYESGDVDRLVDVFDADGFTDMSYEIPTNYGLDSNEAIRLRAALLFQEYSVKLAIAPSLIVVTGDTAYDYGWHEFTLSPRDGRAPVRMRERYFEMWTRKGPGSWKISLYVTNQDVKEKLGSSESHWFLNEEVGSRQS